MSAVDPLRVEGLEQFQAGIRAATGDLAAQIQEVVRLAAELVVDAARPRVPNLSGGARRSLQTVPRAGRVSVVGNATGLAPYYPWLEFGGSVGRGHVRKKPGSGSVKRPRVERGRYIYPAMDATEGERLALMSDGLTALFEIHGIEVD